MRKSIDRSILVGNALDHFDTALYGFLAPSLAVLFFPNHDPAIRLILAYSVLGTALLSKPLGVLLGGLVVHGNGANKVLAYSLWGSALTTSAMAFLPSYDILGWAAPVSLVVVRFFHGLFATMEGLVARWYLLERKTDEAALKVSAWYQSTALWGIIAASLMAAFQARYGDFPRMWRLFFFLGGLVGLIAAYQRLQNGALRLGLRGRWQLVTPFFYAQMILKQAGTIARIAILNGWSYVTYSMAFVFINAFVPVVTGIAWDTMMAFNTALLVLDAILIPIMSGLAARFEPHQTMRVAVIALTVSALPLFWFLQSAALWYVVTLRIWVIIWGVLFSIPLHFSCKQLVERSMSRFPEFQGGSYILSSLGCSLGTASIGRMTPLICWWLWRDWQHSMAPAIYVTAAGLLTMGVLLSLPRRKS